MQSHSKIEAGQLHSQSGPLSLINPLLNIGPSGGINDSAVIDNEKKIIREQITINRIEITSFLKGCIFTLLMPF